MANPIVVEALRGERVESAHRGSGAVVDAEGRIVFAFGDAERPIFPRSAVKALQALPLVESGAADALSLTDAELALAVASHSGEPEHVALVIGMLAKAGAGERDLCCGAHWPIAAAAQQALASQRLQPSQVHNNCSGKHAGFLCLAAANSWDFAGYIEPTHPVQGAVKAALEDMLGETLDDSRRAIDGCSIPTYAASLLGLARGFARFASGIGLSPERAKAARRLRQAVRENPFYVAGSGRFDFEFMTRFGVKVFTKTGAEGVFCAALPHEGLGLAVKADDGAGRAAEVMIASLILRFGGFDEAERAAADRFVRPKLTNWRGIEAGVLRPAGPLAV
jgi:L-asparaginase II